MGDTEERGPGNLTHEEKAASGDPKARPRIRRRLRVIALGLVLLPTLALALLVRELLEADERAQLREVRERRQRVQEGVEELARRLAARPALFREERHEPLRLRETLPPLALLQPVDVDGDCGDWRAAEVARGGIPACAAETAASARFQGAEWTGDATDAGPADASFRLTAGARDAEGYLYLFLRVRDDEVRLRRGRIEAADQLRLVVSLPWGEEAMIPARFVTALERDGEVTTYQVDPAWSREATEERLLSWGDYRAPAWRRPYGVWRRTDSGYDLELRLPLRTLGTRWREARLGLAVVDVDSAPTGLRQTISWVEPPQAGAVTAASPEAEAFRKAWPPPELRLRDRRVAVFDARGRELFASFAREAGAEGRELRARAVGLLRGLLGDDAASRSHGEAALAVARVADGGHTLGFVLEDGGGETPPRRLTDVARESPGLAAVLGAALLLLFSLLAYTGRLSRRILSLVEDVGADRGADDEIGELSRRLSDLVEKVRADRAYLERLPAILGHETLGPLGVVKMFLDDLEGHDLPKQEAARRALRSVEELIEDLREATSLEEALARGERVETDLLDLVRESVRAYAASKGAAVRLDLPPAAAAGGLRTTVIEGRVEQLLDKLLDNAVEFSAGAPVDVAVAADPGRGLVRIRVENEGPPLPEGPAAGKLFEPMWSQRKRTHERHLGMGLYVARVIAEHHGGAIRAANEPPDRVVFEVTLRRAR